MKIIKNILILVVTLILTYILGFIFGRVYEQFIPAGNGGIFSMPSSAVQYIVGWPLSYIFFLTLLFTAFGGAKKYWWIGIGLLPAVLFEVYFDLQHLYFPIAIGLAAWLIGRGVAFLIDKK